MKHLRHNAVLWICCFALAAVSARAATLPADWQHEQAFNVAASGLVKLSLPLETIDAARTGLEDLRVYDDAGNEVSYLIEHPAPARRTFRNAKSFQTSLNPQNTVLTLETGVSQAIDQVTLETPALNFIKAVTIEGSPDGHNWRTIAQGRPIFRQANGMGETRLRIPPAVWAWLRLTVDDQRTQPIPFTGAQVQAAVGEFAPSEDVAVTIAERQESPGETRLTLHLPAANLDLSAVTIASPEPLFTRRVTFAVPQIDGDSIHEQPVGAGVIYALTIEGQPASTNLSVPLETQVRSRELLMLIHNGDSPPLPVTGARAQRRPVYLVFLAKQPGAYHLLSGNAKCAPPRYDLAAFESNLKSVAVAPMTFSPLADNPAYRAPEVLPEVAENGTDLNVSTWAFRKPIKISRAGVQQLELDTDVLANTRALFSDLRVMRNGKQVPYILEHTSISRGISPEVTMTNDSHVSRWILKLPHSGLPLNRLVCEDGRSVFQREMTLYLETTGERGEKYLAVLNQETWTQTPDHNQKQFSIDPSTVLRAPDTLYLQTDNGDNPPVDFKNFMAFYPVTRILFKAKADDSLLLCYGEPYVKAPHYDLSLVANELLAADKATASLGTEEVLKQPETPKGTPGKGGAVFWGILGLVVVALLVVIARLLPKSDVQPPK